MGCTVLVFGGAISAATLVLFWPLGIVACVLTLYMFVMCMSTGRSNLGHASGEIGNSQGHTDYGHGDVHYTENPTDGYRD